MSFSVSKRHAGRSSTRRARSGCSRSRPTWLVAATGTWSPTSCGSQERPPLLRSAARTNYLSSSSDRTALSEEFRRHPPAAGDSCDLVLQLAGDARVPGSIDGRVPRYPRPPRRAAATEVEDRDGRKPGVHPTTTSCRPGQGYGTSRSVERIVRSSDDVAIYTAAGYAGVFDHVVLAMHVEQIAADPGYDAVPNERAEVLSAFRYQENVATLHASPHPSCRTADASGRAGTTARKNEPRMGVSACLSATGWHGHRTWRSRSRGDRDAQSGARASVDRTNRDLSPPAVRRRGVLYNCAEPPQGERRTWFCGSYCGSGFHEHSLRSGLEVAAALGSPAPWWTTSEPRLPPRVPATIGA